MQTIVEDTKSQIARTLFAIAAAFIGLLNFVFFFQVLLFFRFSLLDKLLNQTILYNSNYTHYQVILKFIKRIGFAFGIISAISYLSSIFSPTVGAVLFLSNTLLLFSHFWMILPLTGVVHSFFWNSICVCEFLLFGLNLMMCVISFFVACKDPNAEEYEIQA
jgi:hypothetical protein